MLESSSRDRYIKVGNINTRFWQAGESGSVVVLVHGLGGCIENWKNNIDVLAQRHRVYALDLLGFGRTDKLPLVKDLRILLQFVRDFMDTQHIDKASLVGSSLGGELILQFAIENPQRVEKLVLVDNAGMGRDVSTFLRICALPVLGKLLMRRPSLEGVEKLLKLIIFDPALFTPEDIKMSYEMSSLPGASTAFLAVMRAGFSFWGQRPEYWKPILKALDKIKTPTIIFWGKQDKILPVKHASIAARIPGSKLYIYDKCGHAVMLEHPDEFNKIVLDFLAE